MRPGGGKGRGRRHRALPATDSTTLNLPQLLPSAPTPASWAVLRWPQGPLQAPSPLLLPISGSDFGLSRAPRGHLPADTSSGAAWGPASLCWAPTVAGGSGAETLLGSVLHTLQMWPLLCFLYGLKNSERGLWPQQRLARSPPCCCPRALGCAAELRASPPGTRLDHLSPLPPPGDRASARLLRDPACEGHHVPIACLCLLAPRHSRASGFAHVVT